MMSAQPKLRELSGSEIELVAGGDGGETIVVTGTRLYDYSIYKDSFGNYADDNCVVGDGAVAGGGSGQTFLGSFMLELLGQLIDFFEERAQHAHEHEDEINTRFDPRNIAPGSLPITITDSYGTKTSITMNDGSQFWDTNGNGVWDTQVVRGADGHIWSYGNGRWTVVR